VVERVCLEYLQRSRWVKELQIVNGTRPGEVTAALNGEDAGTIIYAE
jgi:molybdenum storage protein